MGRALNIASPGNMWPTPICSKLGGELNLKNPDELLNLILQVRPDFLEVQGPDVEAHSPQVFKDFAQNHNIPFIIDVGAAYLATSTPEALNDRVSNCVEVGRKNQSIALYLCNPGASTPPENVKSTVNTAHNFGRYEQ